MRYWVNGQLHLMFHFYDNISVKQVCVDAVKKRQPNRSVWLCKLFIKASYTMSHKQVSHGLCLRILDWITYISKKKYVVRTLIKYQGVI